MQSVIVSSANPCCSAVTRAIRHLYCRQYLPSTLHKDYVFVFAWLVFTSKTVISVYLDVSGDTDLGKCWHNHFWISRPNSNSWNNYKQARH